MKQQNCANIAKKRSIRDKDKVVQLLKLFYIFQLTQETFTIKYYEWISFAAVATFCDINIYVL